MYRSINVLKYEIFINPKWLQKLEDDIWEDEHVPAVLKFANKRYKIGLTYRGNVIRKKKKKSYNIIFQKPYLFDGAHEIHLNAEYDDISLSRNKLSLDFFNTIGVISPHSKHVLLYINGYCKGIYLELESFDQHLLKKRNLPDGPIIYATNYFANFSLISPENELKTSLDEGYTIKYGEEKDLSLLEDFIEMINTLPNEEFEKEIGKILNIEKYLRWLGGVVCTQNFDGFIHNYALYLNSKTNLYEITPWDYDGTWGRDLHGRKLDHDFVPITGYNTLTGRLLHTHPVKLKYKEILTEILETHFNVETLKPIIEEQFQHLKPFIRTDPYINMDEKYFDKEKDVILEFIKNRNRYLTKELASL
ncbi:CotH kinase family protein [Neobacillus niacini]|uniref:CotH kinase family protein n=1 Tax=Neobacillus niacini TaxID=86668 RepID=UPI0007AB5B8C|nr:CotH kinase family protein [Neobacillus niacini]MEC1524242.1 CotH kinase family protein [Neobacillus niacini]